MTNDLVTGDINICSQFEVELNCFTRKSRAGLSKLRPGAAMNAARHKIRNFIKTFMISNKGVTKVKVVW